MRSFSVPVFVLMTVFSFVSCEKEIANQIQDVAVITKQVSLKATQDSVLLTGTVSGNENDVHFLWSKIAGDDSVSIENPDSIATWIKGLKEGAYSFKFTVTNSQGDEGTDTVFIDVKAPHADSLVAAPTNNSREVHLFGNNTDIDQTDPNAPELLGGSGTFEGIPVNIRALLEFDLSAIPQTAVITSAKLTLFSNPTPLNGHDDVANSGTNNSIFIRSVTEAWDPTTINWLNQPLATAEDEVLIPHTDEGFEDLPNVDVTTLVAKMVSSGVNNGFQIGLQQEQMYNFRIFCSSKYPDATKHPRLEVFYYE